MAPWILAKRCCPLLVKPQPWARPGLLAWDEAPEPQKGEHRRLARVVPSLPIWMCPRGLSLSTVWFRRDLPANSWSFYPMWVHVMPGNPGHLLSLANGKWDSCFWQISSFLSFEKSVQVACPTFWWVCASLPPSICLTLQPAFFVDNITLTYFSYWNPHPQKPLLRTHYYFWHPHARDGLWMWTWIHHLQGPSRTWDTATPIGVHYLVSPSETFTLVKLLQV